MTLSRSAKDQELLVDLVRRALQQIDAGETVDPVALCGDHVHLRHPLADVLGLAAELPLLQQQARLEDPLAGLVLAGRYRLDACRGRGAMGVVYAGEDQELGRPVAVKILDARLFRDPQAESRFQREAEALAALQHENVVTVHDRGRTTEGIHFLVMELLEGGTLAALLERIDSGQEPLAAVAELMGRPVDEPFWTRLCARWAMAIGGGLAAAHAHGVVHRDVKPSNVFLRADGRPVLLDFGIAARASPERLTATQTTLGTPWYMAPEQVRAGAMATVEPMLDVYALGALLYHLLAGRPPYEGDAASVLAALQTEEPTPLSKVRSDVPGDLVAIVEHCLERDPARRYATAAVLVKDLEAFLAHRPVSVRPLGPLLRRWRTWRRAPARPIAVAAVLATAVVIAIAAPQHFAEQRRRRAEQKNALYATLPSLLAIEGWPDERVLSALQAEHDTALELLDRILALDAADLPVRQFRAALRLDLDDREGAADDLRTVAAQNQSPFFAALAKRYLDSDPQALGALAIDTAGLPTPETPAECYVAGFHELRARHVTGFAARADALLERAGAYLPARDLRMLSLAALAEQKSGAEQQRLLDLLYDETVKLEVIYGGETARTQAMRGTALVLRKRYAEAVPCLQRSLELRPERHGPHQNLGVAFLNLGKLEECERHLREAMRLRPFVWNTPYTLAQLELARDNFAAADHWAESVPTTGSISAWSKPNLLGNIAVAEAIHLRQTAVASSRAAASRAVEAFDAALAAAPQSKVLARRRQLALALSSARLEVAMVDYARILIEADPLGADGLDSPHALRNFAFLLPSELGTTETAWIRALLWRVAANRAGGNAALRKQLAEQIEELLKPFR